MAKRTREEIQEKIEGCEWRLENLQRQEKVLKKREKELERNARTHRLIERGAILESYLINPLLLSNDQIKEILEAAFDQPDIRFMNDLKVSEAKDRLNKDN